MRRGLVVTIGVLAAVALDLAGPALAQSANASTVPRTTPVGMVGDQDLQNLEAVTGFRGSSLEWEAFGAPGLVGPYDDHPVSGLAIRANMVMFRSYGTLKTALADHALPRGTTWVGLDLEAWPGTPLWQRKRPTFTESLAETVVHAYGLRLINMPGVDLLPSLGDKLTMDDYLDVHSDHVKGLAAGAAKYGDAVDIQAQRWERRVGTRSLHYAWLVKKAASQALHANPSVLVLAGLSTCPQGVPTNVAASQVAQQQASMLLADYEETNVDGYWLNVPDWASCPTGNAQSGVDFLQNIYGSPSDTPASDGGR
ncbi:MAG TPA: hypothetical protein VMA32_16145 [Streptosporangiaceae bacterium]|nr:hypothetical protein [Streptosporangiaceae bacterium]